MPEAPVALLRGAIDPASTAAWLAAIDAHPAWQRRDGDGSFNAHSSSLRLAAVPCLDAVAIARILLDGAAGAFCRGRLGDTLACDVDQCWVRRQYAPSRYPPGHSPHAWHQDGALGFDFLGAPKPLPADGLLAMVTCWIALTPCGDEAPGLELLAAEPAALLTPKALHAAAIGLACPASDIQRPVMAPGDCLAFGGGVLHHTYVAPSMRHDRTSLEIRLFDARRIAERLRGDRFVALH